MQNSLEATELAPTIVALQERLETVRKNELERIRRRPVSFRPEQQDAIEELTRRIVTTILLGPVKVLQAPPGDKEPAALLTMVQRIFNLVDRPEGKTMQDRQPGR